MALDLDAMAFCHLGSGKWPCLKRLDIMNVKRIFSHNEDIELLVHGWYPLLQTLHIGSNSLCYASGVAELIKGHWPLLQSLQVGSFCQLAH